jgi:hypothetical protein
MAPPRLSALTSPLDDTETIARSEELHEKVTLGMGRPAASRAVAVNCAVSPTLKLLIAGLTSIAAIAFRPPP